MNFLSQLGIKPVNEGAISVGDFQSGDPHDYLDSISPATGELIAKVACATYEDYERMMKRAQSAFKIWREVPAPKRGEFIRQVGQALREHKDALGSLVALEMGKSKQEGDGEVQEMIDIADFAVGQSRMLYGKTMHSERIHHRMYEQWHPLGLVGVISAFNFPVAVWAWNAFIAAVCGNITLWKPSTKTPLCAIAVMNICQAIFEKNKMPSIFNVFIPSQRALTGHMVEDKRIALISFTGSTAVGREVGAKVARRLGRSLLELGGNNAMIVDESADLTLAIPAIVFGAVGTAGQRCTSTRRLLVAQEIYETVVTHLKNAYEQLSIGNPLDLKHHMGPLIDKEAVKNYLKTIDAIKLAGGEIVYGGKVLPLKGAYVEPTLVTGLDNQDPIVQEETFAPILYVIPFKTLADAIAMQNAVPQGLSSALFTQNLKHSEQFLSAQGSDCGIANINIGTSGAEVGGAFGGEKETGGGRESGSDAWKGYMRRQTNTINWGQDLPLAQGIEFNLEK